jgi:hypothetical protein
MYRIRVKNHVDASWSYWFGTMQVTHLENGVSELKGPVEDQEMLYRILEKIRDLNLGLLSIESALSIENKGEGFDWPQTSTEQEKE